MNPHLNRGALAFVLSVLLAACVPSPFLVPATIPQSEVHGRVIDGVTGAGLAGATVIATAPSGGFWSARSTYHLAHAETDGAGKFTLVINERGVLNLQREDSEVSVNAYLKGYYGNRASIGIDELKEERKEVVIRAFRTNALPSDPCASQNDPQSCKLIRAAQQ